MAQQPPTPITEKAKEHITKHKR